VLNHIRVQISHCIRISSDIRSGTGLIADDTAGLDVYDFVSAVEVNRCVCYFAEYHQFFYPVVEIQAVTSALHDQPCEHGLSHDMSALVVSMSQNLPLANAAHSNPSEAPFGH
jgi:hypothetical protein